tara:strand:- start:5285 stop:5986 length:702 start_codon:yes stop_codon:yes gene_type:complete
MAKQVINIGTTANDGTGDPLRTAFDKVNDNFTELYSDDAGDVGSIIAGTGISVDQATGNVTVTNSDPNATHTGDVTGATALTIANDAVTNAKINNNAVNFDKLSTTLVITESEGIGSNDNDTTLPTSAAVKDYVDSATGGIGVSVISSNTNAASGNLYVLTANLTLTLPSSPSVGSYVKVSNRSGVATCTIARNSENIMGAAADLTLDKLNSGFELIYSGSAQGWVLIGVEGA